MGPTCHKGQRIIVMEQRYLGAHFSLPLHCGPILPLLGPPLLTPDADLPSPPSSYSDGLNASAAFAAASQISQAMPDSCAGMLEAESGKFRQVDAPHPQGEMRGGGHLRLRKVPSHILVFLFRFRTSHTHLPQFLRRTTQYTGCLISLTSVLPALFFFLPPTVATIDIASSSENAHGFGDGEPSSSLTCESELLQLLINVNSTKPMPHNGNKGVSNGYIEE